MQTQKQQDQALIRLYRQESGMEAFTMLDVAKFAISRGVKPPKPKTPEALLAERFSAAAREETAKDEETGRPYRVNVAVTQRNGSEQMTLWHNLDSAPRFIAHKGLMQRREQMVGDAVSLSDDADHWNRIHPNEEQIQIPLDFEFDVMLRHHTPPDEVKKAA